MSLELRIPPVVVLLLCIALVFVLALLGDLVRVGGWTGLQILAPALFLAGFGMAVAGVLAFRKAHTTIDPSKPKDASSLVTGSIYRFTRNPMYLGMVLILLGWILKMGIGLSLLALFVFIWFISKYQIAPEERLLGERFGEPYTKYCQQVRRWL